jgi:hypothetical protein
MLAASGTTSVPQAESGDGFLIGRFDRAAPGTHVGNTFRREGDYWSVTFDGRTVQVRDRMRSSTRSGRHLGQRRRHRQAASGLLIVRSRAPRRRPGRDDRVGF